MSTLCVARLALLGLGLGLNSLPFVALDSSKNGAPVTVSDRDLAAATDSLVQAAMRAGLSPGFGVSVVRNGRVIWQQAYGYADASAKIRASNNTRWYVASTSKSFTGFAMALLDDGEQLPFTTSMRSALPGTVWHEGVNPDSLSIAKLLSHTHNLSDNVLVVSSAFTGAVPEKQWPSLLPAIRPAGRQALIYSNVGYNIAGMILDRRSAGGWRRVLDSAVFAPAGMRHTTATLSSVPRRQLALPHTVSTSTGVTWRTVSFDKRDATMHAAGGHVATLDDLSRWVRVQIDTGILDGRVIFPASAIRRAHTIIAAHTEQRGKRYAYFDREGWGAGWDLGSYEGAPMVSRFGGYAAMRSHLSFLPARRIGVVAMANGGLGSALTDLVAAFVYDVDAGRPDARSRATQRLDSLRALWPDAQRAERAADSLAAAQERAAPVQPVALLTGEYRTYTHGLLRVVKNGTSIRIEWGVVSSPVRTSADGSYRFSMGGTDFTLRFEWDRVAGVGPATAVVVNDVRLPRARPRRS